MDCNWREAPENPGSPVRRGIPPPADGAHRARGGPVTTESLSDGDRVFSTSTCTWSRATAATGSGSGRSGAARPGPNSTRSRARCATDSG